ncbi:MAG: hypothetical protein AB7I27_19195 [Bacteriovoracaceae bacterium]
MTQNTIRTKAKIDELTRAIKAHWKRSVESLILTGKCLHELRKIMPRKEYLEHLKTNLGLSEMQSHRIENLYLHFHTKASTNVLSSKPSVLYLLTSTVEPKKIESLAKGGKVFVGGRYKTLPELSVKDVTIISKQEAIKPEPLYHDEKTLDLHKSKIAHRRLATLIEEIADWSLDLKRFSSQNIQIKNSPLVKRYVKETIECLKELELVL